MQYKYEHHMLVRQEHLNQYGNLFGGRVLSVIDELAFIACSRTYPNKNFVTRAVHNAQFDVPAVLGDLLEFKVGIEKVGRTSITVRVTMNIYNNKNPEGATSFDGTVIMVCVDQQGNPVAVQAD
jgi:acyl-CoA thioesterase YciA